MSKMRLKPATIGVVRSAAMPQAVKHRIRATNSSSMPWPISGSLRVSSGSSATAPSAIVLMGPPLFPQKGALATVSNEGTAKAPNVDRDWRV